MTAGSFGILFVCYGNICRSPMAEGLARALIEREYGDRRQPVKVSSCGIGALVGNRPTLEAITVMSSRGIDISGHKATPISADLVSGSDLVLTMEEEQRIAAKRLMSDYSTSAFLLLELGRTARAATGTGAKAGSGPAQRLSMLTRSNGESEGLCEVPDPIGLPIEDYEKTLRIMEGPINDILLALLG